MMMHRCEKGLALLETYVGRVNSDQTEGRGPYVDHSIWTTSEAAHNAIKGQGVMGVGDGDVYLRTFWACAKSCGKILVTDVQIYDGYSARGGRRKGFGPDGWRPDMSPLYNDPEYKQYIELKKKFEPEGG